MVGTRVLTTRPQKSRKTAAYIRRTWMLYLMLLLPMLFFLIFRYIPMTNIVIAFKDFNLFQGTWASKWSGFSWFIKAFGSMDFLQALRNTIFLNFLDLLVGFPAPILLALLLNELTFRRFKRVTQTIVYLPHFLSWIIITGMARQLFGPRSGIVNIMLSGMGFNTIDFLTNEALWTGTYIGLGLWKEIGWNTIIYLAAITAINPELYEAAEVDGASRLRKIWHITLPGLRPTIVVLLIMSLGRILSSEFDRPYALGNDIVRDAADVISTLVYREGIRNLRFAYAAAIGVFQSVVCVLFIVLSNAVAKRTGERGIM